MEHFLSNHQHLLLLRNRSCCFVYFCELAMFTLVELCQNLYLDLRLANTYQNRDDQYVQNRIGNQVHLILLLMMTN